MGSEVALIPQMITLITRPKSGEFLPNNPLPNWDLVLAKENMTFNSNRESDFNALTQSLSISESGASGEAA